MKPSHWIVLSPQPKLWIVGRMCFHITNNPGLCGANWKWLEGEIRIVENGLQCTENSENEFISPKSKMTPYQWAPGPPSSACAAIDLFSHHAVLDIRSMSTATLAQLCVFHSFHSKVSKFVALVSWGIRIFLSLPVPENQSSDLWDRSWWQFSKLLELDC